MKTFKKEERLCSKKLIDSLYNNGSSFLLYPFKIHRADVDLPVPFPAQVLISVPKRRFKRAHDRNLLKRRIREAYRIHKDEFLYPYLKNGSTLLLGITFIGKEIGSYHFIEKKLIRVFEKLAAVNDEGVME